MLGASQLRTRHPGAALRPGRGSWMGGMRKCAVTVPRPPALRLEVLAARGALAPERTATPQGRSELKPQGRAGSKPAPRAPLDASGGGGPQRAASDAAGPRRLRSAADVVRGKGALRRDAGAAPALGMPGAAKRAPAKSPAQPAKQVCLRYALTWEAVLPLELGDCVLCCGLAQALHVQIAHAELC